MKRQPLRINSPGFEPSPKRRRPPLRVVLSEDDCNEFQDDEHLIFHRNPIRRESLEICEKKIHHIVTFLY